jgi:hypothetical protein
MHNVHNAIHEIIAAPLNVGWKVLTALTVLSVLDMGQNLLRRVRHIFPSGQLGEADASEGSPMVGPRCSSSPNTPRPGRDAPCTPINTTIRILASCSEPNYAVSSCRCA